MEEGTKLSHQLGSANTALRKLRAKEKESEVVLTKKRERMESSEKRIQDLETALEDLQVGAMVRQALNR
jgi:adenylate cyclase class IV